MHWTIFWKQTLRNFKKNWTIFSLVFFFVVIGMSLLAGVVSYLFNAYHFTIERAFRNGSYDALFQPSVLRWTPPVQNQDLTFSDLERIEFKNIIPIPSDVLKNLKSEEEIYTYLLDHEGYIQSFLYGKDLQDHPGWETDAAQTAIREWLSTYKFFGGSVLAAYFSFRFPALFNENWDVRGNVEIGKNNLENPSQNVTAFLGQEVSVQLATFVDEWIPPSQPSSQPKFNAPSKWGLFQEKDFEYDLQVSTELYWELLKDTSESKPIFLTPKSLKTFNLHPGDSLTLINKLLPIDKRLDSYIVVGTATAATDLFAFTETLSVLVPYSHFWETLQTKPNYLSFTYAISTGERSLRGFSSRYEKIQAIIQNGEIFEGLANAPPSSIIVSYPPNFYYSYTTFWVTSQAITTLVIVATTFLVFFVVLFITNQLIDNNKQTLQFLKCLGLSTWELSLLNTANVLFPILIGFLIAIPGLFVVQNLISFLLAMQYPMVLNYWRTSPWIILIYVIFCLLILAIFLITNSLVLKRKNLLVSHTPHWIRHIRSGKVRQGLYRRLNINGQISLAINGANIRKILITLITLLVTFSIILFGVGFRGSINYQGRSAIKFYRPYKNYSAIQAPLFSLPDPESSPVLVGDPQSSWSLSQKNLLESEIENTLIEILCFEQIAELIKNQTPFNELYISSKTLDSWLEENGNNFEETLEELRNFLESQDLPVAKINQILTTFRRLYDEYLNLKLELTSLYNYNGPIRFFAGHNILPDSSTKNWSRTLELPTFIAGRFRGRFPPSEIQSIGLIDQTMRSKMELNSENTYYLDVKISQSLANRLKITKTELTFSNPTFTMEIPLNQNTGQTVQVNARVMEIIKAEFVFNRIFYSLENLQKILSTANENNKPGDPLFAEQLETFKKLLNDPSALTNGIFSDGLIPNQLLNFAFPIIKNKGINPEDYFGDLNLGLSLSDYKLMAKMIADNTAGYIKLINNITIIFVALTIVVALLLTYLFLVRNRSYIILFKSLGYSISQITNFMIWGYVIAAIIAVGLAVGISVLVVTLLGITFNDLFNITISFSFTVFYSFLIFLLPLIFITLILFSLWIYTYEQDPQEALKAS